MRYRLLFSDGQSITEALVILPFFLLLVFILLQLGQIGVSLVTANYAAGSIARHAMQEDTYSQDGSQYMPRLHDLMFAGMQEKAVSVNFYPSDPNEHLNHLNNVRVDACIELEPFPLVGPFLYGAFGNKMSGDGAGDNCTALEKGQMPIYFVPEGRHYHFIVHGTSSARMNYRP